MSSQGNLRRLVLTLIVMGLLTPWLVSASQRTISTMFNSPPLWVPDSFDYRRNHDWFKRVFKCDDTVLVSFVGCNIDDNRLPEFSRALLSSDEERLAARNQQWFQIATTGPEVLAEIRGNELNLPRFTALARLKGSFVGPDLETSCALVVLTEAGGYARRESLDVIRRTAQEVFDIEADQLVLVGAPVDGAAIDTISIASIKKFAIPSALIAVLLCWWCLRSWLLTLFIVLAGIFGQGLVLALATTTGDSMNAILIVLPVLVFVLTVSTGVHLVNYHREALRRGHGREATKWAIQNGWLPCLLATATTVIGLASLSVSEMTPIRTFSLLASLGVSVTLALLFLLLPAVMDLQAKFASLRAVSQPNPGDSRVVDFLAQTVMRFSGIIIVAFVLLMALLTVGLFSLKTSVNIRALFTPNSRILEDYRWLEENLGPLVPVEVIVQFEPECEMIPLQRMELVRDAQILIAGMDGVGGSLSAASFFRNIPAPGGARQTARRVLLGRLLTRQLDRYKNAGFLADEEGRQSWRISARVSALEDVDYGQFLDLLRAQVGPFLRERGNDQVTAVYTGSLPVTYQAQQSLLDDLFRGYLTAFTLVVVVMVLVLRNVGAGLVVMLPNLFPTLLVFGFMGWMGIAVDIGSVMTASVALGIAVDDTLHFLVCYRRETEEGTLPPQALRNCFQHCGRAMVQTSLICGLGMLVYVQSDFVPTRRFAGMMLGLLLAALAGDLILLPALLVGRCGGLFRSRPK